MVKKTSSIVNKNKKFCEDFRSEFLFPVIVKVSSTNPYGIQFTLLPSDEGGRSKDVLVHLMKYPNINMLGHELLVYGP